MTRFLRVAAVAAALCGVGLTLRPVVLAQAPRKLKVHISADMEGITGVVTSDQLGPTGFEYGKYREVMTREVLAVVQAAKEAGATDILVADSHGNAENLLIEQFPPDVRIIRSFPRRLEMMAGIDATFDAAIFVGTHASTNNAAGTRAHTFSSATLTRVAINGTEVTEGAWNAAVAGQFGVPVILATGDSSAMAEIQKLVGPIEVAAVKDSLGFHSILTMTPQAAVELIASKAKAAFARRTTFKPYVIKGPVTIDVSFKNYLAAEILSYWPGIERTASHAVRFTARDMAQATDMMAFITNYRPDITP